MPAMSPTSGRPQTPQAAAADHSAERSVASEPGPSAGCDVVERRAAIAALFHIEKAIGSHAGVLSPSAAAAARGVMHDPRALIQYVRASENKPDTAAALIIASATAGDSSDEASGRSSSGDPTQAPPASTHAAPRLDAGCAGDGPGSDTSSDGGALATPEMLAEITGLELDEAMVLLEASEGDLSGAVTLHLENAQVCADCSTRPSAGRGLLETFATTCLPLAKHAHPRPCASYSIPPPLHTLPRLLPPPNPTPPHTPCPALRQRANCGATRPAWRTSDGRRAPRLRLRHNRRPSAWYSRPGRRCTRRDPLPAW